MLAHRVHLRLREGQVRLHNQEVGDALVVARQRVELDIDEGRLCLVVAAVHQRQGPHGLSGSALSRKDEDLLLLRLGRLNHLTKRHSLHGRLRPIVQLDPGVVNVHDGEGVLGVEDGANLLAGQERHVACVGNDARFGAY